jgi:hypothetical protein
MRYGALEMCAFMGVQLSMHIFLLWVMQGSYVFSGRDEDVDFLLVAKTRAPGAIPTALVDGGRR